MSDASSVENDLRDIDEVNRRDVQFALANDADLMMSQWTDDVILLQTGAPIMRGRAGIAEAFRTMERPEIVEYVLDIQEVKVLGDYAFQWGTYHYGMRPHGSRETFHTSGKIMRILQRQSDGAWRIHRGMTTID